MVETTSEEKSLVYERDESRARETLIARILVAALCVSLSVIAVVPFFFMGQSDPARSASELRMPVTHDMFLHYDQMRSFYRGLEAGEIYPRWEEDTNRGFGAPTTSYYPPGVYYVTALTYAMSGGWVGALMWAMLLMMAMSGGAMYAYARGVMGRAGAAVAMGAYMLLPYHLVDQYQRGAIAELMGFVWMPLMMWGGDRLMGGGGRRGQLKGMAVIAMSYGGFVWTHPPTAYQYGLGLMAYVVVLGMRRREWKGVARVIGGMVMGLGLSAAYLFPAAIEQNLIHKEYILGSWPYHNTYVFVHDLFNYEMFKVYFARINAMWIFSTGVIIILGVALLAQKKRASVLHPDLRQRVWLWATVGCLASFMMTAASKPIGVLIPKIEIGVFTWRMLSISTLVMALLIGACVQAAMNASKSNLKGPAFTYISLASVIVAAGIAFSALFIVGPVVNTPLFVPEEEHLNQATIPSTAPADPEELPDDVPPAELAEENGTVKVEVWEPEHRVISVVLNDEDSLLIRTFNFPGWTATVGGKPVEILTDEELGDMEIVLPAGEHEVRLDYRNTPTRQAASLISISSFALLLILAMVQTLMRARQIQIK